MIRNTALLTLLVSPSASLHRRSCSQRSCNQNMFLVRISSVVLLLTVVFFIGCAPQTEEIKLAVAGLR